MRHPIVGFALALTLALVASAAAAPVGEGDELPGAADRAELNLSRSLSPFPPMPSAPEPIDYAGMLEVHNRWRAEVGAGPLTWSEDAARTAQDWAESLAAEGCLMRHNPAPERRARFGENIYRYWRDSAYDPWRRTAAYVVDAWGSEKPWYDLAQDQCSPPEGGTCGHYTQMIWAGSHQVGCGRAHCGTSEVWVCNYYPRGNFVGMRPLDVMPWERVEPASPPVVPTPPQAPTGFRRVNPAIDRPADPPPAIPEAPATGS